MESERGGNLVSNEEFEAVRAKKDAEKTPAEKLRSDANNAFKKLAGVKKEVSDQIDALNNVEPKT